MNWKGCGKNAQAIMDSTTGVLLKLPRKTQKSREYSRCSCRDSNPATPDTSGRHYHLSHRTRLSDSDNTRPGSFNADNIIECYSGIVDASDKFVIWLGCSRNPQVH
jgi:hypothetical protein